MGPLARPRFVGLPSPDCTTPTAPLPTARTTSESPHRPRAGGLRVSLSLGRVAGPPNRPFGPFRRAIRASRMTTGRAVAYAAVKPPGADGCVNEEPFGPNGRDNATFGLWVGRNGGD